VYGRLRRLLQEACEEGFSASVHSWRHRPYIMDSWRSVGCSSVVLVRSSTLGVAGPEGPLHSLKMGTGTGMEQRNSV